MTKRNNKLYLVWSILLAFLSFSCGEVNTGNGNQISEVLEQDGLQEEVAIVEKTQETMAQQEVVEEDKARHMQKEEVKETVPEVNRKNSEEKNEKDEKDEKMLLSKSKEEKLEVASKKEEVQPEVIRPDHSSWNDLLKSHVTASGKVNYKAFKDQLAVVADYLEQLKIKSPKKDWTRNEKLAYWFNLYNASTVYLVTSNYPVKSITEINGGKPWDKKFVKSGEHVYTLNEVENTIVRPKFNEPRAHAALNCAAISCPKLLNAAFVPERLNAQLEKQAKAWVNDVSKNKLTNGAVEVSKIFEWYSVDFKSTGVVGFLNKYAATKVADDATVSYLEYDWTLNE